MRVCSGAPQTFCTGVPQMLPSIEWAAELRLRLSAPRIVVSDRVRLRSFALPNAPDWHLESSFFRLVCNMA